MCLVYERAFGLPGVGESIIMEYGDDILLDALRDIANDMW